MHSLKYFFVRPASNFNANFKDRDCERCKDLAKWESLLSFTREAPLTWMIEEVLTAANYQPPKQVGPQSLSKSTAWNTNNMKQRNDGDGIVSRKWMGLRYISYWIWLMDVQNNHLDYFGYLPNFAILFLFSKSSFSYGFYLKNENFVFYLKYKENMCGTWFALQFFQVVIKPRDPVSSSL